MKAIDALTINDEYRLKKKIVEYEEKLKDVPKDKQLESHLANKILEQEAIKKQLEKLRTDKEKETQIIQQKYEQDMKTMREAYLGCWFFCNAFLSVISMLITKVALLSYALLGHISASEHSSRLSY